MQTIPAKTDILGFNLNANQQATLTEIHRLCAQRMAVKLPALNSAKCKTYDTVQTLDERIAKYAPLLELTRMSAVTGTVIPVSPSEHARIVWQYHFIKHPISM